MAYTLQGLVDYLEIEGIDAKHSIVDRLKEATSIDLKGIRNELNVIITQKVLEERKQW